MVSTKPVVPVDDLRPEVRYIERSTGEDVTDAVLGGCFRHKVTERGATLRVVSIQDRPTPTQQAPAGALDIEAIWERCTREGIMPQDLPEFRPGQYGDVSCLQECDLTELINRSRATTEALEEFAKDWRPAPPPDDDSAGGAASDPPAAT